MEVITGYWMHGVPLMISILSPFLCLLIGINELVFEWARITKDIESDHFIERIRTDLTPITCLLLCKRSMNLVNVLLFSIIAIRGRSFLFIVQQLIRQHDHRFNSSFSYVRVIPILTK